MRRCLLLLCSILLLFLACQSSEEDRIYRTLSQREEALRAKDLSLYLSCISKAYQDKQEDYEHLKNRIEHYFRTFDRIDYSSWDRSIHFEGKSAVAVQQFRLEVEKGARKSQYSGKESLQLEKDGKEWKIIGGL